MAEPNGPARRVHDLRLHVRAGRLTVQQLERYRPRDTREEYREEPGQSNTEGEEVGEEREEGEGCDEATEQLRARGEGTALL